MFPDSSPITIPSPSSKACRKSGPFPPPELPGLNGPMDLSDARSRRHLHDVRGGEPHAIGPPPITRIALPACCAHYPGEPERVRLSASFPVLHGLPRIAGGSAFAALLSRPAQASLILRPTGLLSRPRRPLSQGSNPLLSEPPVSYSIKSTTIEVEPSSTGNTRLRGAPQ